MYVRKCVHYCLSVDMHYMYVNLLLYFVDLIQFICNLNISFQYFLLVLKVLL